MERIMGRAENPVRNVLNYASDRFLRDLPIVYVLTVVDGGRRPAGSARPVRWRRRRVLSPRRRAKPESEFRDPGHADSKGGGLSRSA